MNRRNEFDPGVASNVRADAARATDDFRNLRAAVLSAAVEACRKGPEHLREVGGITAVMKRTASLNDRAYVGLFNVPRPLSELLDFGAIRLEAQRRTL